MTLQYQSVLSPDDNGTFLVTAPAFPELTTYSETDGMAEVGAVFVPALEEAIAARIAVADNIPPADAPGEQVYVLSALSTLKVELYRALLEKDLNRAQLAKELGWHREQVDRLFRLGHLSRLDQIDAAARVLGLGIDVGLRKLTVMERSGGQPDITEETIPGPRAKRSGAAAIARMNRNA